MLIFTLLIQSTVSEVRVGLLARFHTSGWCSIMRNSTRSTKSTRLPGVKSAERPKRTLSDNQNARKRAYSL
jgi:hypothetical protein